jgi:hypothetical protein
MALQHAPVECGKRYGTKEDHEIDQQFTGQSDTRRIREIAKKQDYRFSPHPSEQNQGNSDKQLESLHPG